MTHVSDPNQTQSTAWSASSTSPTTDSDITVHSPPKNDVQSSVFSEAFARVESRFNYFLTAIHPSARIAAISAIDKEIDEQLKAVDEQHRAVDAAKQLLHTQLARRNALAPISLYPQRFSPGATHVCQFWRQVALDDSSLWATIWGASANTELIAEMLARARNAPLNIDICLNGSSGQKFSTCSLHTSPILANFASMARLCFTLAAFEVSIVGKLQPWSISNSGFWTVPLSPSGT
ncbi:hypothetical protein BJV77DRAFT_1073950 [Russula vinacea]|nr:hypothetical protein BJV77DRAFT_1073950 [Russula vinacea]